MTRVSRTELERKVLQQVRAGFYIEFNGVFNCGLCGEQQEDQFNTTNPGLGTHTKDCETVLLRNQWEG